MNGYEVTLTPEAAKDIKGLDTTIVTRILDKIEWLGVNADIIRHQVLQEAEWSKCFKYRVGDYRIIYNIDHRKGDLVILKVGHRRDIYK